MENLKYLIESEESKTKDSEEEKSKQEEDTELNQNIKEYGILSIPELNKNPRGNIRFLPIIGQIEGHNIENSQVKTTKYEHVIPHLIAVSQSDEVDGLLIILNTVGGDVEAGLAISELISHVGKPTVSLVLGGGHSIGVPIAVSANYSFIAASATMTLHPVRYNGTTIGVPQTFNYLRQIQNRITEFIVKNSGIAETKLNKLMFETTQLALDVGTIVNGNDAVELKLIDEVGGLTDATEKLFGLIDETKKSSNTKIKKIKNSVNKKSNK